MCPGRAQRIGQVGKSLAHLSAKEIAVVLRGRRKSGLSLLEVPVTPAHRHC